MPRSPLRIAKPGNAASPHAAMQRSPIRSRAHNLTIAARLASLDALPGSMMLASLSGLYVWRVSELASLKQADTLLSEPATDARRVAKG